MNSPKTVQHEPNMASMDNTSKFLNETIENTNHTYPKQEALESLTQSNYSQTHKNEKNPTNFQHQ